MRFQIKKNFHFKDVKRLKTDNGLFLKFVF